MVCAGGESRRGNARLTSGAGLTMRVLLVHDYGTAAGGAERITLDLREGLRARGHDARLFASTARDFPMADEADYHCHGSAGWQRRLLQVANPWASARLREVLPEFRPDVVHVRMFLTQLSPLILQPLAGVPTLWHTGSYHAICPLNTRLLPDERPCTYRAGVACLGQGCVSVPGMVRTLVQQRSWHRGRGAFRMVVANSHDLARQMRENAIDVHRVIWNGTHAVPGRAGLSDVPVVSFSSRLAPRKGADVLLRAMAIVAGRIPTARTIIAGEGPERARLEQLARELKIDHAVEFCGHLVRPALDDKLHPAWVHTVPSRLMEPFTNSLCEAMMRGVAVVASDGGGTPEVLQDGASGFVVRPGDAGHLAERLLQLLGDRAVAMRMGREARRFALANLTTERMIDQFEDAYSALAKG